MIDYIDLRSIHDLQKNQQQQQQSELVNKERLLTDEIKLPLSNRCCVEHISSNVR